MKFLKWLWRGMCSITLFPEPLEDPRIREILEKTPEEALREDYEGVLGDYSRVSDRLGRGKTNPS
jgi:hypothetical protein